MIYLFWTLCGFVLYTTLRLSFTFLGVPWTWESYLIGLAAYLILTFVGFFLLRRAEKKKKFISLIESNSFVRSSCLRFDFNAELCTLKMVAYNLMRQLNVDSILIEFVPYEKNSDPEEPLIVTLEPFGGSKWLKLFKKFFKKNGGCL